LTATSTSVRASTCVGRRWVVSKVDPVEKDDLDRRLVAQEVEEAA
jgi:hypothetical protein